jgi:2-oxoisovalerate dehydrogenase E1 component alpha subunit
MPLQLHIPEPPFRPGDRPDFSALRLPPAGTTRRPLIETPAAQMREMAYDLIGVLDKKGAAIGPWHPGLDGDLLKQALRTMLLTRAYDDRMYRAQRQGKTSFYMKCSGEEAVAVGAALALNRDDMGFPTYRQQGFLIARDYPISRMMCQIYSNAADPLKGRQMPTFYSSREHGFFSISGNLGTQFSQAVGWAMASAYKQDDRLAIAWIGEGATAEADFHYALTLAAVYHAPVILTIVNNQWAISSYHGIAGGEEATFASRAIGYGLPALRVDGNDILAVYAATRWAAERAHANLGATVIELYTYRREGHSTSDDPTRYRPKDEPLLWPLGEPIERLKQHLIVLGVWSEQRHDQLLAEIDEAVRLAGREAEEFGTLGAATRPSVSTMFDDVYREIPRHLLRQRQQLGG